ncbi:MAG: amidase family protein [Silicimonas sp.]
MDETSPAGAEVRLNDSLARLAIVDAPEQGIFAQLFEASARREAQAADDRRKRGLRLSALDGMLVSLKASIDVAGVTTVPGHPAFSYRAPAQHDAALVTRLRDAGAVIVGTTQMSELAFSGLGLNAHEPPLRNPVDPTRITGGSSSGAAASVAAKLVDVAIGGDTGGSIRIPAALCGVTGFKPSAGRVSVHGVFPLSHTLDCMGPLAEDVQTCGHAFQVLSGLALPKPVELARASFSAAAQSSLPNLDPDVEDAYLEGIEQLRREGAEIDWTDARWLTDAVTELDKIGAFTVPELKAALEAAGLPDLKPKDDLVAERLSRWKGMTFENKMVLRARRDALSKEADRRLAGIGPLLLPTVPCVAPEFAELTDFRRRVAMNDRVMLLTRAANLLDLPALALPIGRGNLPASLSILGRRGQDAEVLAVAAALECIMWGRQTNSN